MVGLNHAVRGLNCLPVPYELAELPPQRVVRFIERCGGVGESSDEVQPTSHALTACTATQRQQNDEPVRDATSGSQGAQR